MVLMTGLTQIAQPSRGVISRAKHGVPHVHPQSAAKSRQAEGAVVVEGELLAGHSPPDYAPPPHHCP
jgi:hypothetical protein